MNEVVVFGPFAKERQVAVKIVDDNQWEPDEEFFLRISILNGEYEQPDAVLGRLSIMEIIILDDDGISLFHLNSNLQPLIFYINVIRTGYYRFS